MKIFVYGTLKKGRGNNGYLNLSKLLGSDVTVDEYTVYDCGFPYMCDSSHMDWTEEAAFPVEGEVYEVDMPGTQEALDRLEGVAYGHYEKKIIRTKKFGEVVAYLCGKNTQAKRFSFCEMKEGENVYCF